MGSEREVEGEGLIDVENTVFVAVGKNVKESKSTLLWALQNSDGKKICLLHVHQAAHLVTLIDGKLSANKLKEQAIKVCREFEQQKVHKLLNQYLLIITQFGLQACKIWVELDSIEKGIVQLIAQHDIRWLVMGAAADKHYSTELLELKSKKAIFVCQQAPVSCHIWFTCHRYLVYTRFANPSSSTGSNVGLTSTHARGMMKLQSCEDAYESDRTPGRFASQGMVNSNGSTDKEVDTIQSISFPVEEEGDDGSPLTSQYESQDTHHRSSSRELEMKSRVHGSSEVYDKLEHSISDAENFQKAFEESVRRWKAEEDALEAMHKAEASESLYMKEINERKELEEVLARQQQELEKMQNQLDQFIKELHVVQDQKLDLQSQLTESRRIEEELEEKIIQAAKLLVAFKEKRDKLRVEHNNAVREINGLKILLEGGAETLWRLQSFTFSFLEINEATRNFEPSWKIGDGRYGSIYKGFLRHLKVAVKMFPFCGSQDHQEFELQAGVLSRVRHPNLVTLIGTCPESRSLVYEYLENGNLEDRLTCQGKTPPLPWQTRTRVASEICSALIFLHSSNPCIVHGNLKPTKVLLDANFISKLSDLGIHKLIPQSGNPACSTTLCNNSDPGVSVYIDPEFIETGELTPESDVYSFGIVLLRLLTGRPALGVKEDVKCALESGDFTTFLDFSAGEWPFEHAKQLAHLALKCCEKKRLNRPNLVSDVWTVIKSMRDLCTSSGTDPKLHRRIPSHFVCPILQEVMEDPHVAADGFTYEAEAIKGWLNSGHKTSPMTNLKLEHCDLLPNYALYYAIQEWQQQS